MKKSFAVLFAILFHCHTVQAATLSNGDFSNGLTGWTTESFIFGNPPISPSPFIQTTGTNPYAQLQSPFASSGTFLARLSQSVEITAQNAVLSFDVGLVSQTNDVSDPTVGSTVDNLVSGFELNNQRTFLTNLRIDQGLTFLSSMFGGTASATALENPALSSRVSVDLSGLIGETVTLLFQTGAGDDAKITNFGVDNIRFDASPTYMAPVPLPAPFFFLLAGLAFLFGVGWQKRSH